MSASPPLLARLRRRNDAPPIDERAATRGRIATKGGHERAGVKRRYQFRPRAGLRAEKLAGSRLMYSRLTFQTSMRGCGPSGGNDSERQETAHVTRDPAPRSDMAF